MARGLIRGMVRYKNRVPARGAIIILERMVNVFNEELKEDIEILYPFSEISNEYIQI